MGESQILSHISRHLSCVTNVMLGSQLHQLLFVCVGHVQRGYECPQILLVYLVTSSDVLELLIRIAHSILSHDLLDGFGQDLPVLFGDVLNENYIIQIRFKSLTVGLDAIHSALETLPPHESVPKSHTMIAHDGGIREVSLEA